jgi:hypothetical protein
MTSAGIARKQEGPLAAVPLAADGLQHLFGLFVNFPVVLLGENQAIALDFRLGQHVQHIPLHVHCLHCLLLLNGD